MRHTGRFRVRFVGLARKSALYVLAGAIWATVLSEPAGAPSSAMAFRPLSLDDERRLGLAERASALAVAASRSEPAPAPVEPSIVWPARGALTGWFGERRGGHRHPGVDIDGTTGDEVVAAAAGRVVVAGPAPAGYGGYGTVVIIDHGDGLTSISAHLSGTLVKAGQEVEPGQRVGSIGTSGKVTGSHLHFELRRRGTAIDPKGWLPGR